MAKDIRFLLLSQVPEVGSQYWGTETQENGLQEEIMTDAIVAVRQIAVGKFIAKTEESSFLVDVVK